MDLSRPQSAVAIEAHDLKMHAGRVIDRCLMLAAISDDVGRTTRTYLSPAMRLAMAQVQSWMESADCTVWTDTAGNLHGLYAANKSNAPRLIVGSHLDTVPNAGAFDGILGVMMGLSLVELLAGRRLHHAIELVAFSEEEGVRFGVPFIGSRAMVGGLHPALLATTDAEGVSVAEAIRNFGLEPIELYDAAADPRTIGYLEFHIEQGPVLESTGHSLGLVETIAGQTRGEMTFFGAANHAGTTPMSLRHDAVAAMAEWVVAVEQLARSVDKMVATVGRVTCAPAVGNVIAKEAKASLDLRHAHDMQRTAAVENLVTLAQTIAVSRGVQVEWHLQMDQPAIAMDARLTLVMERAMRNSGTKPLRMMSGAGHDAMVLAERMPAVMVFLQSPGGISHHPDETVRLRDVADGLAAGLEFLSLLEEDSNHDA